MKASELIKVIQTHIDQHGDQEILIEGCGDSWCESKQGGCEPHDDLCLSSNFETKEKAFLILCEVSHRQFVADEIAASEGY